MMVNEVVFVEGTAAVSTIAAPAVASIALVSVVATVLTAIAAFAAATDAGVVASPLLVLLLFFLL